MSINEMNRDQVVRYLNKLAENSPHALLKVETPKPSNGNRILVSTVYIPHKDSRFPDDCFESGKGGYKGRRRLTDQGMELLNKIGVSGCHRVPVDTAEKRIKQSLKHYRA